MQRCDATPFSRFGLFCKGKNDDIHQRERVVPMKRKAFITLPDGEHWTIISHRHFTVLEPLRNGHGSSDKRHSF